MTDFITQTGKSRKPFLVRCNSAQCKYNKKDICQKEEIVIKRNIYLTLNKTKEVFLCCCDSRDNGRQ
jgi:hypothetical protein